jgi:hypothetical protein
MLYELRLAGTIGPAAREAFSHLAIESYGHSTVLSGDMDEAGLYMVLERIRAFGIDLVDIHSHAGALPRLTLYE